MTCLNIQSWYLYIIGIATLSPCRLTTSASHFAVIRTGIFKSATVLCIGCTLRTVYPIAVSLSAFVPLIGRRTVIATRSTRQGDVISREIMVRTTYHGTRRSRRYRIQRNNDISVDLIRRNGNCSCSCVPCIMRTRCSSIPANGNNRRRHRIVCIC